MNIKYRDPDLQRLAEDRSFRQKKWSTDIVKAFRKQIHRISQASDERDLYAIKALRLEKLSGNRKGTSSIRINDQYRLMINIEKDDDGKIVVIIEIVDYH